MPLAVVPYTPEHADELRADGVRGVSFGVAAANARAIGFYEHMGFERLAEYEDGEGYTFCMRFDEGSVG